MNEEIPSRRTLLRGALTVGCSLLVPAALLGCDSKPKPGASAPTAPTAPTASAPAAPADSTAQKKVPQASVQYQPQPKGEQKCSGCTHFIADSSTCKLVDGQISSEGWCALWAKKA